MTKEEKVFTKVYNKFLQYIEDNPKELPNEVLIGRNLLEDAKSYTEMKIMDIHMDITIVNGDDIVIKGIPCQ
jgi:hypothetical protein